MSPVVHFEMPFEDRQRMVDFYTKAFSWKSQLLGPEMGDYVTVSTSETKEDGFPTEPGKINGGLFKKNDNNAHPSVVIAVEDIRQAMKQVVEAGGTILGGDGAGAGEPDDIPGIGLYCGFVDPEGNRVSMIQPTNSMANK